MNLYLHGVGNGGSPVEQADTLASDPGERFDVVIANPPFGKKSSYKVIGEDGQVSTERENYEREDFKFTTSNKQFNFLQHIMTVIEGSDDHVSIDGECERAAATGLAGNPAVSGFPDYSWNRLHRDYGDRDLQPAYRIVCDNVRSTQICGIPLCETFRR